MSGAKGKPTTLEAELSNSKRLIINIQVHIFATST